MMGRRVAAEPQLFYAFRLEEHVPERHLLRRVDALLDTGFVRRALAPFCSGVGRPSVDPELLVRMLLVGYLMGIRSERRLCDEVHLNLAYRWFCRLGLDDAVPNHSTFSRNRHRRFRGSGVMQALFAEAMRRCAEAGGGVGGGLGGRRERPTPPARPPATGGGADRASVSRPVREYLETLDAAAPAAPDEPRPVPPERISPTDPAAGWSAKGRARE